jgi:hypothetical protein
MNSSSISCRRRCTAAVVIVLCAGFEACATTYTNDTTLSDFTNGVTFATFTNRAALSGDLPGDTPTVATINVGNRVYGNDNSPPILVSFGSPTANLRVFANIDHFGSAYDGYQYTIAGSNDGATYSPLFDALTVNGAGEPFTLGSFAGTAPTNVNNVLIGSGGGEGITGYIADFTFGTAYQFYSFRASTVAIQSGNSDQELSAVGSFGIPEPGTCSLALIGLCLVSLAKELGIVEQRDKTNRDGIN